MLKGAPHCLRMSLLSRSVCNMHATLGRYWGAPSIYIVRKLPRIVLDLVQVLNMFFFVLPYLGMFFIWPSLTQGPLNSLRIGYFPLNALRFGYFHAFVRKKNQGILAECQTVWIQIRPNILSDLIWVQTIWKGFSFFKICETDYNHDISSFTSSFQR